MWSYSPFDDVDAPLPMAASAFGPPDETAEELDLCSVYSIHDQNDSVHFRLYPSWWNRRTHLERLLFVILLLVVCCLAALLVALILIFLHSRGLIPIALLYKALSKSDNNSSFATLDVINVNGKHICMSHGCVTAASRILASIDPDVKPCDDFYKFACGNWERAHVIPEDKARYSVFTSIRENLEVALRRVLEAEDSVDGEPVSTRKAKRVFRACMNESAIDARSARPAIELLKNFAAWPLVMQANGETWDEEAWDWQRAVAAMRRDGADFLISMGVWADSRNSTRYIIYLDQPGVGMPSTEYMLRGADDKYVQGYYTYMLGISGLFNVSIESEEVRVEMREMLEFEIELAKLKTPREERRNDSRMYNKMTIGRLEDEVVTGIRWREYFDTAIPAELNVTDDEEIIVKEPEFFRRLLKLIDKTKKRTVANYLGWRTIQSVVWDLDYRFRAVLLKYKKILYGTSEERARWRSCVQTAANFFDMAVGRLYVHEYFNGDSKAVAVEMIKGIREAFDEILPQLDWMDDEAQREAKEKAEAVKQKIGFPDFIMNTTALDAFFNGTVASDNDHFGNVINNSRVWNSKFLMELRKPFDKDRWSTGPAVVNAFYSTDNNAITFPAGILQPPFFSKDQPRSMNYGAIGMVIGHELTHGFDDQGRQKDKNGNLRQWWTESTIKKFEERARCIIHQYGNFTVPSLKNMSVNGVNTQGENIADNGGLKQAYLAYQKWLESERATLPIGEPLLPGLDGMTHDQLFFVNYAMVWCGLYRPDAYVNQILSGVHSPGRFRVIGPLANSREFAAAFQCPADSPMNPTKKCELW